MVKLLGSYWLEWITIRAIFVFIEMVCCVIGYECGDGVNNDITNRYKCVLSCLNCEIKVKRLGNSKNFSYFCKYLLNY